MPVEPRGFFSSHWEKMVFGVVALGALAAGYFAYERATLTEEENPAPDIQRLAQQLQEQVKEEAEVPEPSDFMEALATQYGQERLPEPPVAPTWAFWPPLPTVYPTVRVGVQEKLRLRLDRPVDSVNIVGDAQGAEVQHPVGANYELVELKTGDVPEGEQIRFRVVGTATPGRITQQHILPVVVSQEYVGKVQPPLEFSAESKVGHVLLSLKPNPANEGAGVYGYAVYRKRADDLTGGFEELGVIESRRQLRSPRQEGEGGGQGQSAASMREMMRQVYGGGRMLSGQRAGAGEEESAEDEEEQEQVYEQRDYNVETGKTYIYKVRTVAARAPVPESDFTEPTRVKVKGRIGWKFTYRMPAGVRFEFVRQSSGGNLVTQNFTVGIGEMIGGSGEGTTGDFLTNCYLVDYHDRAQIEVEQTTTVGGETRTRKVRRIGRIIYEDENGDLRVRWRQQSPSELWKKLEED